MIVANWKCNGSKAMINEWTNNFLTNYVEMKKSFIGIAPPSIYIESILDTKLSKFEEINIGSQDIDISSGARTGAISYEMILDFDCKFSIIGHSERRQFFNESNSVVKNKALHLIENKIIPVICIGETLKERQSKLTKSILSEQLQNSIPEIANYENSIIAYEPIWAIGTGLTPTLEEINDIHSFIKSTYSKFNQFNILYGGSVKSQNSVDIVSLENVNGCLIGGASLKVDEFNKIIS